MGSYFGYNRRKFVILGLIRMTYFKKGFLAAGLAALITQPASAFIVKKIEFQGLERISEPTALSYLPVVVGEDINTKKTATIISTLYKTGFFNDIHLMQEGDTLIIKVLERPTISEVNVIGNDEIPKDKLDDALKKMGLEQGAVFERSTLTEVQTALAEQYYSSGYYNAIITPKVTEQPRNRVAVEINVSEGRIAKVEGIRVVGNHVFSESTLVNQFTLTTPDIVSFFSGSDKYSKDGLYKSIEALKNYYLNHGYINMRVDSQQVTLTPDRKYVYIVVSIVEGEQYKFGQYTITGDSILPVSQLAQYVKVVPKQIFSRQNVLDTSKAISDRLGDLGYAYARVEAIPHVDDKQRIVNIEFKVVPGVRYYVRRVNFEGNLNTTNIALRNYITQIENSQYSKSKIDLSERNLRQLPYLDPQELSYGLTPVTGTNNQLDVDMKVKEILSAAFQFNIGYSQAEKFMVSTSVTQQNFMGTGKTVGVSLSGSAYSKTYSLNYVNPFFTPDGVSHSMSLYFQKVNAAAVSIANFSTSSFGFSDSYTFPLSNYDSFNLGYGLRRTNLLIGSTPSTEMTSFEQEHGSMFNQLLLTTGWNHNTTDRYRLPTSGNIQGINGVLSLPIDKNKLQYYTVGYDNVWYLPLNKAHTWIINTLFNYGYGSGYGSYNQLPFFQNYYAGGLGTMGQVRGYEANTLGPRDSLGNSIGGNELITGSIGLIIPNPGQNYGVRTTAFFDAGNVYNTKTEATNLSYLRYSTGMQIEWWTPLGMPLDFSFARALHARPGDSTDFFQFGMSGSF